MMIRKDRWLSGAMTVIVTALISSPPAFAQVERGMTELSFAWAFHSVGSWYGRDERSKAFLSSAIEPIILPIDGTKFQSGLKGGIKVFGAKGAAIGIEYRHDREPIILPKFQSSLKGGIKVFVAKEAAIGIEYRYDRVFYDRILNFDGHSLLFGLSVVWE